MAYLIAASSAKPKAPSGMQSAIISQTAVHRDLLISFLLYTYLQVRLLTPDGSLCLLVDVIQIL